MGQFVITYSDFKMKQSEETQIIIYNTDDGKARVTLYAKDGNV